MLLLWTVSVANLITLIKKFNEINKKIKIYGCLGKGFFAIHISRNKSIFFTLTSKESTKMTVKVSHSTPSFTFKPQKWE